MPCMTTAAATVKKAALGRKKSPPLAVKKTAVYWKHLPSRLETPSPVIPKVREFILAVFEVIWWHSFLLGKAGVGLL